MYEEREIARAKRAEGWFRVGFEKKVEHYLEYSGWEKSRVTGLWRHAAYEDDPKPIKITIAALFLQLKADYETYGHIERAAEILEDKS